MSHPLSEIEIERPSPQQPGFISEAVAAWSELRFSAPVAVRKRLCVLGEAP